MKGEKFSRRKPPKIGWPLQKWMESLTWKVGRERGERRKSEECKKCENQKKRGNVFSCFCCVWRESKGFWQWTKGSREGDRDATDSQRGRILRLFGARFLCRRKQGRCEIDGGKDGETRRKIICNLERQEEVDPAHLPKLTQTQAVDTTNMQKGEDYYAELQRKQEKIQNRK